MINFSDIISTTLVNISVHVHKCACQIFIFISQISTLFNVVKVLKMKRKMQTCATYLQSHVLGFLQVMSKLFHIFSKLLHET